MTLSAARVLLATLIAVALSVVAPAAAFAGTSSGVSTEASAKPPLTVKQYNAAVRVINLAYAASIAAAKQQLNAALADATTLAQKLTARAKYRLAVVEATDTRDAALVALGKPPAGAGLQVRFAH